MHCLSLVFTALMLWQWNCSTRLNTGFTAAVWEQKLTPSHTDSYDYHEFLQACSIDDCQGPARIRISFRSPSNCYIHSKSHLVGLCRISTLRLFSFRVCACRGKRFVTIPLLGQTAIVLLIAHPLLFVGNYPRNTASLSLFPYPLSVLSLIPKLISAATQRTSAWIAASLWSLSSLPPSVNQFSFFFYYPVEDT